jgi:hypothetical protein
MRVSIRLVYAATSMLSLIGCHVSTNSTETAKEVIENKPAIAVSDLPTTFLDAVDTSSERSIKNKLNTEDSLTLDGTTLTIGNVGDNRTVTLACHKLKMINGARIVTNGNQLNIIALDMEFNNSGGIDSFYGDTVKAETEKQGSNGGRVEIYSLNPVFGSLRISLPGQIGGTDAQGAQGGNGNPGGRGNDAVDGVVDCSQGGGNGGKGTPGGTGGTGHPGKGGGNGGDLLLQGGAAKDADSHFPYQAPPGAGGAGGPGGPGGSGGPGGDGGSGKGHCSGGRAGAYGDPGAAGAPGDNGPAGASAGKLSRR